MAKNFKNFLHSLLLVTFGIMLGFHIIPYFIMSKRVENEIKYSYLVGKIHAYKNIEEGKMEIRDTSLILFPKNENLKIRIKRNFYEKSW